MNLVIIFTATFSLAISIVAVRLARLSGRNRLGWFLLCLLIPPLIILLWQFTKTKLRNSIPKVKSWIVRIITIVVFSVFCLLIGEMTEYSLLLDKIEAVFISFVLPVEFQLKGGHVILFAEGLNMAMPGGVLNSSMAFCAMGSILGGLVFLNQPKSTIIVLLIGLILGLATKFIKDVIFVALVWFYSISGASYVELVSPITVMINTVLIYYFAFLITKNTV